MAGSFIAAQGSVRRGAASSARAVSALFLSVLIVPAFGQTVQAVYTIDRDLAVSRLSDEIYVITHAFPWPANSLYVACGPEDGLLVDTPYTPEATEAMLAWFERRLGVRRLTAVNTGFHFDNLGGNAALKARGIPVWGADATPELIDRYGERSRRLFLSWLAGERDQRYGRAYRALEYETPDRLYPLEEGLSLTVGDRRVEVIFPGETHTPDNTVVYLPELRLLFGGCMLLTARPSGTPRMRTSRSGGLRSRSFSRWSTGS